jgi:hypothetical protein
MNEATDTAKKRGNSRISTIEESRRKQRTSKKTAGDE